MTTIVFKDGVLAADRQCTANGSLFGATTKIKKIESAHGTILIGAAGGAILCREWMDWVSNGMQGAMPELHRKLPGDDDYTSAGGFIFYAPDRMLTFSFLGVEDMQVVDSYCDGSGGEFARGALAAGATLPEAIEIACRYDINSGCGMDMVWLPGCEPAEMTWPVGDGEPLAAQAEAEPRYVIEWLVDPSESPIMNPPGPLWTPPGGIKTLEQIMEAIRAKPEIDPHGARRMR
jgi:hypothetical protein